MIRGKHLHEDPRWETVSPTGFLLRDYSEPMASLFA